VPRRERTAGPNRRKDSHLSSGGFKSLDGGAEIENRSG